MDNYYINLHRYNGLCQRCCYKKTEIICEAINNKNKKINFNLCDTCFIFIDFLSIVYDIIFIHYKKSYNLKI